VLPKRFGLGDNDQQHMIRHKAICPNRYAATAAPLGHELDVGHVIAITKERPLSTISSLCYMMWYSRSYHVCQTIVNGIKVRAELRDKGSSLCYERPH
jgi:hypothetical protein